MERNGDENKKNDAQILAQLRRRPAPINLPEGGGYFWFDEARLPVPRAPLASPPSDASTVAPSDVGADASTVAPSDVGADASTVAPSEATSRSEALRRLVAQGAPKEPMSALSPTLRSLREELNSADAATFATAFVDKSDFADDAELDLLESTLDAGPWRDANERVEPSPTVAEESLREAETLRSQGKTGERRALGEEGALDKENALTKENVLAEEGVLTQKGVLAQEGALAKEGALGETGVLGNENGAEEDAAFLSNEAQESGASENGETSFNGVEALNSVSTLQIAPLASFPALSGERQAQNETQVRVSDLMVVSNLKKGYVKGKKLIPVLQGVDLTARQGELLAIVGQSGSGKSTLLHLMGTLDAPDAGTIHFDGQRIDNLSSSQRDVLRNHFIGMIFQFYHLIPEMTTLENVLAPLMIRDSLFGYWRKKREYVARAKELLALVGLSHRLKHRPNELSGGEMQRASIARALISNPRILLADEPTGNLDSKAAAGVLKLLRQLNEEQNLTIVMVTHDMAQAAEADRAIRLVDGLVVPE